ncbi:MAG: hypothetical protein AAAB13_04480 [Pseudomonas sp.]
MRLIKPLVLLLVVALGALALYLWLRDEAPTPKVQAWLSQIPAGNATSAAYLFLAGLDAAPRTSPAAVGKSRLQAYQAWLAVQGPTATDFNPDKGPTLDLPEGAAFCSITAATCFDSLLARRSELPTLLAEHAALLGRYRYFLHLRDYRTLTAPGLAEPLPPVNYLMRAQQLLTLQVLQLAQAGEGQAALALLQEDQAGVRLQLAQADQLVLKMALVEMLNQNLEWLVRLHRAGLLPAATAPALLSEGERSLRLPLKREFATGSAVLRHLREEDVSTMLEETSLFFDYKPQMTINASQPLYQRAVALSLLTPAAFRRAVTQQPESQVPNTGLRNRIGNVLLEISGPTFIEQVGQVQDLDSKIKLVALSLRLGQETVSEARLAQLAQVGGLGNPYQMGQRPYLDRQQRLCFQGPLPPREGGRCVRL